MCTHNMEALEAHFKQVLKFKLQNLLLSNSLNSLESVNLILILNCLKLEHESLYFDSDFDSKARRFATNYLNYLDANPDENNQSFHFQ